MSDETTNTETTTDAAATTQAATSAGTENTEQAAENMIPHSRFEEVNKARKAAETELAKLRKQAEDAESATLAEQKKFEELYQKEQAKAASLEKRFEELQASQRRDRIKAAIESAARTAGFAEPADAYLFLDVNSIEIGEDGKVKEVDVLVKGLATAKPYLVAQREVQPGNGARPKPAGHGIVDAEAQKQASLARAQSSF